MSALTVSAFGSAALVATDDVAQAQAVTAHLRTVLSGRVGAIVPGAESVLVHPAPGTAAATESVVGLVEAALSSPIASSPTAGATVTLPVRYDGDDLTDVASLLGVSVEEIIARHTAPLYTVDFLGFAPGFPYLSGLDPFLSDVPRLDSPRTRVPAGSVGLAAGRTCVYPTPSPGGWRLLGTTDTILFDPANDDSPALLAAGMRVRFEAVR